MRLYRLSVIVTLLLLGACAGVDRGAEIPVDDSDAVAAAWRQDASDLPPAVRLLVSQADELIDAGRLADAETVLNRCLRIDNRTASVWSRLAWIAAQQQRDERTRDLIKRSNSLSRSSELLRFNWSLYRAASERLGDTAGVRAAESSLEAIN